VKKTDGMRRPVSDGMLYAPKLSTCCEAQEISETGLLIPSDYDNYPFLRERLA